VRGSLRGSEGIGSLLSEAKSFACDASLRAPSSHVRALWPRPPHTPHRWSLFLRETALLLVEGPFKRFLPEGAIMVAYRSLCARHAAMDWSPTEGRSGNTTPNGLPKGRLVRLDGR